MHIPTDSPIYQKAFELYLRKGTPLAIALKRQANQQRPPTPRYMWVTAGDEKVRPSHAANDLKIFDWDDPPPTGNPGDEPGCRCTAMP